jgi:hypothetical protein
MTNPTDIRQLADLRIEEADNLNKVGFPDGAFYLAGYAVELYLKAKICENLNLPTFYSQYAPKTDLAKTFLIHNLDRLILLSGLLPKFESEKATDPIFTGHCVNIERWSEKSRYDTHTTHNSVQTSIFIESVKFITQWIKMN